MIVRKGVVSGCFSKTAECRRAARKVLTLPTWMWSALADWIADPV